MNRPTPVRRPLRSRRSTSAVGAFGVICMALAPVAWVVAIIAALVLVARSALTDAPWADVAYAIYPAATALVLVLAAVVLAGIAAAKELK